MASNPLSEESGVCRFASSHPLPTPLSYRRCGAVHRGSMFKRLSAALPRSKAAIVILLWNVAVGHTLTAVITVLLYSSARSINSAALIYFFVGVYGLVSLLQMLCYPLGGLLADLRCGRHSTVFCSKVSIWLGYTSASIVSIVYIIWNKHGTVDVCKDILRGLMGITAVFITPGFQANAVQFGLDQLQDASSSELSVFLHWFVWMDSVGILLARVLGTPWLCNEHIVRYVALYGAPHFAFFLISVLLVLSYYKRHWFYREPRTNNPYGTVYRVLKFVAKHDKPLRRSAFAYCDDERPSRIEFAKKRFGGPFTTETVEDVKTFLRILLMLVAIGPVFFLYVASVYIFPLFALHIGPHVQVNTTTMCGYEWLLLQSGNLSIITPVALLPLYIIFLHPHVPRWFPRILRRLGCGILMLVLSVTSMLAMEGIGHMQTHAVNGSNISCMFLTTYEPFFPHTLNMKTLVLLAPNLLIGMAVPFIYITVLEFISAQSPHTMKGLLLGVFYTIRGFFIILGCVFTFPFAQTELWQDCDKTLNCGFYYYLMNTLFGIESMLVFMVAARWYQYRIREDRPYDHYYAESYYSRYTSPEQDDTQVNLDASTQKYGSI